MWMPFEMDVASASVVLGSLSCVSITRVLAGQHGRHQGSWIKLDTLKAGRTELKKNAATYRTDERLADKQKIETAAAQHVLSACSCCCQVSRRCCCCCRM